MPLIPTDTSAVATSLEVFEPNGEGYCRVVVVYRVMKNNQAIFFPVETSWHVTDTLTDADLHDADRINDVLALYGYVLP